MLHSAIDNPTLDAPKLLNDTQHSHSISNHVFIQGRKHKMLQRLKANKITIIPSKISSAYECNKTIALLPRFELAQIFEHEWTNNTLTKSHSTKMRLSNASRIVQSHELHDDNRQTQSNAHFLMPKISFSDLKLEDTSSVLQH